MQAPLVFFDVDTQADFMLPTGSLYVPGADEIVSNLKKLMSCAAQHGIPVLSSADAHAPDDPSFREWPPHCVVGTPGQRRIAATEIEGALIVPNRPGAFSQPSGWPSQIVIEKQQYDATTNANFDAILAALGPGRFVIFGVATDYCVQSTALSLLRRGFAVDLVIDAIRAITQAGGQEAIESIVAAGGRQVTTQAACSDAALASALRQSRKSGAK
jgi:nicotinamidase/pyrazinamidase